MSDETKQPEAAPDGFHFTDAKGDRWEVDVNVGSVKRTRKLTAFDILDFENAVQRLMCDPVTLVDALYCICKPQLDAAGIDDEAFAERMKGDAIKRAKKALVGSLVNFPESPEDRENLRALLDKFQGMAEKVRDMLKAKISSDALSQEIDNALARVEADLDAAIASGGRSGS